MAELESVVMYKSWLEVARSRLSEEDACKLMVQLMEYGLSGKIPQNDNAVMSLIFDMAKPNIDSNIKKRLNGQKGGRRSKKTSGLSNAYADAYVNANAYANENANECATPSASAPVDGGTASGADEVRWVDARTL